MTAHTQADPDAPVALRDCGTCQKTLDRKGMCSEYFNGCDSCTARGIARSAAAFYRERDPGALRDLVKRLFPRTPINDALKWVWYWWHVDHPHGSGT